MGKPESSQTRLLGQEKNLPSFQILKNMAKSLQLNSDGARGKVRRSPKLIHPEGGQ